MTVKRYRLALEFVFEMAELTDEVVHQCYKRDANYAELIQQPWLWAGVEMQRQLLAAMLKQPDVLQRVVRNEMVGQFEAHAMDAIRKHFGDVEDEEDLLAPLVPALPAKSAKIWQAAVEHNCVIESLEEWFACFRLRLERASFQEETPDV